MVEDCQLRMPPHSVCEGLGGASRGIPDRPLLCPVIYHRTKFYHYKRVRVRATLWRAFPAQASVISHTYWCTLAECVACTFLGSCAPVIQRFADSCEQNCNGGSADHARNEEVASRLSLVPMCLWRAALVLCHILPSFLTSFLSACRMHPKRHALSRVGRAWTRIALVVYLVLASGEGGMSRQGSAGRESPAEEKVSPKPYSRTDCTNNGTERMGHGI
jgi:hypothetical protein